MASNEGVYKWVCNLTDWTVLHLATKFCCTIYNRGTISITRKTHTISTMSSAICDDTSTFLPQIKCGHFDGGHEHRQVCHVCFAILTNKIK